MNKKVFFNQISNEWETEHSSKEEQERLKGFVYHFNLRTSETVLDVGCGSGRLIPFIKNIIGEKGILIELDFSEEMLKIGKKKYLHHNLFFVQSDAQDPALKSNLFTTIICMALFPHLDNKPRTMKQFYRILKPGGKLIIAHQMSREELNQFHRKVKGPVTKDLLPGEGEMRHLFASAGFHNLTITDKPSFYIAQALA